MQRGNNIIICLHLYIAQANKRASKNTLSLSFSFSSFNQPIHPLWSHLALPCHWCVNEKKGFLLTLFLLLILLYISLWHSLPFFWSISSSHLAPTFSSFLLVYFFTSRSGILFLSSCLILLHISLSHYLPFCLSNSSSYLALQLSLFPLFYPYLFLFQSIFVPLFFFYSQSTSSSI